MTERIEITKLTHGPNALGRCKDGKVVFIPHAAPGDVCDVIFTKETASYREGIIKEVITPGPSRTKEACPFSGTCGGCNWMHITYEEQLRAKREDVLSQLIRVGKKDPEKANEIVGECIGSKRQLGYRNKIELACGFDERNRLQVGFHKHASSEIITPQTCPLAVKEIQKAPQALKGALAYLQGTQDLGLIRIGVRGSLRTKDCEVALWTKPGAFPRGAAVKTIKSALPCTSIVRVMAQPGKERKIKGVEALYGKGCFEELLCQTRYKASAPSFFQVNTAQAETLVSLALEGLGITKKSTVADLYCGVGTFALSMASCAKKVYAVESAASSVRDLKRNAELNNLTNISIIGGDSARELAGLGSLDALIVDPPRAGLAKNVPSDIARSKAKRVAYVSCNPSTWARDILRFENEGYELIKATPVDLFPQTYHVETVSILERKL